ncbi:hypothetical protein [Nocardioides lijunqiniae]|nr:hypothetical protein [Nocardioides lijunqiniae]
MREQPTAAADVRGHEHQWALSTVDYDDGGRSVSRFDCPCGGVTFR